MRTQKFAQGHTFHFISIQFFYELNFNSAHFQEIDTTVQMNYYLQLYAVLKKLNSYKCWTKVLDREFCTLKQNCPLLKFLPLDKSFYPEVIYPFQRIMSSIDGEELVTAMENRYWRTQISQISDIRHPFYSLRFPNEELRCLFSNFKTRSASRAELISELMRT